MVDAIEHKVARAAYINEADLERIAQELLLLSGCTVVQTSGVADRVRMTSATSCCLFVRAYESVRVIRDGHDLIVLSVEGPGPAKAVYGFEDEARSRDFLARLHEKLLAGGWSFEGLNVERRSHVDRRAIPRTSPERRRLW
jgi:hypothetical protein